MILYFTKQTIDRYKIRLPDEMDDEHKAIAEVLMGQEQGDSLLEWGGKLFYFDRRKCIQVVNFASKFTLFLVDVKKDNIEDIPDFMMTYIYDIFYDDKEMTAAIDKMVEESPITCFDRLKDKSAISTLNRIQLDFLQDGYYLYNFIQDGILHTREVNRKVNFNWLTTVTVDGKKNYYYPGEIFREMVLERFGDKSPHPHLKIVK